MKMNPKRQSTATTSMVEDSPYLTYAHLIGGRAQRLERLAAKVALPTNTGKAAKEPPGKVGRILKLAQALREDLVGSDDLVLHVVGNLAEIWAETVFDTDRKLARISTQMRVIERRDNVDWELDDPDAPQDFKALATQLEQRFAELEPIPKRRVVAWLCSCGEVELATLYLNDLATFLRRWEAGRLAISRMDSDAGRSEPGRGDTGLT